MFRKFFRTRAERAEMDALWAAEREITRAPQALRERSLARAELEIQRQQVQRRLVPLAGVSSGVFRSAPTRWFRLRPIPIALTVLGFAGLSAAAIGLQNSIRFPDVAETVPASTGEAPVVPKPRQRAAAPPEVAPPEVEPAPTQRATPVRRTLGSPKKTSSAEPPARDERELGLLQSARTAISQGRHAAALTQISEHQRLFPSGALRQEREALRVRALWGSGRRTAAKAAAVKFRTRYPKSGLLSWMGR